MSATHAAPIMIHFAHSRGFTLIEMIVVIVLTSIIASGVAVFMRMPIQGYVDMTRRAELSDEVDTALRRMGRDLRLALPNSVRVTDGGATIEILLTKTGGRYRIESDATASANALDFAAADTQFDQLGTLSLLSGQSITLNSDRMVIYNLGPGVVSADAYAAAADNNSVIRGLLAGALANEQRIQIDAKQFPLASPGNRFQVIEGPVSYVCANGQLTRYWGYAIQPTQPNAATLPGIASVKRALAASHVGTTCNYEYAPGVTERGGLVALTLALTRDGETVQLYHEVHVSNVP